MFGKFQTQFSDHNLFSGRYTLGLYQQMDHKILVAQNTSHYVNLVTRLFFDKDYQKDQANTIRKKFQNIHLTHEVAKETLTFLMRLTQN